MTAGCHTGVWLGAAFGAVVAVFGGFAPLVFIGAVVGAVVGGIAGIAIGSANGVVLALLAATSLFDNTARHATRTATAAAVITTAIGGLAVQLTLLGNPPNIVERIAVYAPVTMGALAAAALSRRLPPGQSHHAIVIPSDRPHPLPGHFDGLAVEWQLGRTDDGELG